MYRSFFRISFSRTQHRAVQMQIKHLRVLALGLLLVLLHGGGVQSDLGPQREAELLHSLWAYKAELPRAILSAAVGMQVRGTDSRNGQWGWDHAKSCGA